jgi:citrate synthase
MSKKPSWLSARQAAALLDVKLATLYAYKSRGLVESITTAEGRRYARASIERLKARHDARRGHAAVAAGALRFGEPSLETSVSEIRSDGPYYRGIAALTLCASDASFEAVCDLLLQGQLPVSDAWSTARDAGPLIAPRSTFAKCEQSIVGARRDSSFVRAQPVSAYLAALVGIAGLADEQRQSTTPDISEHAEHARARRIIAWLAERAGGHVGKRQPRSLAQSVLLSFGVSPTAEATAVVNRTLVLCADHELNASTFAARVAASTGSDLYACLGAALNTHTGARHGEAPARLIAQLRAIKTNADAAKVLREHTARGERMHGFGHPLYPQGDPRGRALVELAQQAHARTRKPNAPVFERLQALSAAMQQQGYPAPNLDAGLVAVCSVLGLPPSAPAALFAIGRCPGWIAHALEQRRQPFVLRPRAKYVAPTAQPAGRG